MDFFSFLSFHFMCVTVMVVIGHFVALSRHSHLFSMMSSLHDVLVYDKGLDSKLQHYGPCKNSWKKSKTSHLNRIGHIEGDIMHNLEPKKKRKKVKNQDFMGKTNYFLRTLPFSPWAAACRSSLENT
jgi:hypothetical protein